MRNRILLSLGLAFFFLPASYGRNERVVVFGTASVITVTALRSPVVNYPRGLLRALMGKPSMGQV